MSLLTVHMICRFRIQLGECPATKQRLRDVCIMEKESLKELYQSLSESIYTLYLLQCIDYSIHFSFIYSPTISHITVVTEIKDILTVHSLAFKMKHVCHYQAKVSNS